MTPTLRDELKKIMEAAGKATPGNWMDDPECAPLRVFSDYIAPGRTAAVAPTVCETPWSRDGKQGKADAAFIAMCSPERIKALAEVAMAAEATMIGGKGLTQTLAEHSELWAALERLRKAVGT